MSTRLPRVSVKTIYTRPTKVQTRSVTRQKEAKDIDDQDAFEYLCQATPTAAVPPNTNVTSKIWGLRYSDHIATHGNFLFVEPLTDIDSSDQKLCSRPRVDKTSNLYLYLCVRVFDDHKMAGNMKKCWTKLVVSPTKAD